MPPTATAPTAAPPAPSKPAAQPPPQVTPPPEAPISFDDQTSAELAELDDSVPKKDKAPAKPADKLVEKPAQKPQEKPADKPVQKPEDKPAVKPDEKKPAADVSPEDAPNPTRMSDLRHAYDALKKRAQQLKAEKLDVETKLKSSGNQKPVEVEALTEKLTATEKRNAELESDMRFINYTKSKEFKEQYEKPYTEAYYKALAELSELTVTNEDGTTRQASAHDLLKLCNLPLGEARTLANHLFGDSANDVMAQRRELRRLAEAQTKALEDQKTLGEQREKDTIAERARQHSETIKMWEGANNELSSKYPKWFAPIEGDESGNTLLEKGRALADRLFSPTEDTRPKTVEESIKVHALIRNKVANHDRLALHLKTANARIKELEESLAEYEKSEPPAGKAGDGAARVAKSWDEEVSEELAALDKA